MAKTKMKAKQVAIPKFSSEAEEAAWWDNHRSEVEAEIRQRMKQKRPLTLGNLLQGAKSSVHHVANIEDWKEPITDEGCYQTYIKMLLREALEEHASR
jgi:hypothetical protein